MNIRSLNTLKRAVLLKMSKFRYFAIFCLISIVHSTERESTNNITVIISQADPLLQNGEISQTEIGMKIIEAFVKKINHNVEYLVMNETLSNIFNSEISFEQFTRIYSTSGNRWVKQFRRKILKNKSKSSVVTQQNRHLSWNLWRISHN